MKLHEITSQQYLDILIAGGDALNVSQLPEHPKWKRVSEEVACLLLDQGSKVYGWNLHSADDLVTIIERIGSDEFASGPLGWLFEHRSMALGGDRTAYWVETE